MNDANASGSGGRLVEVRIVDVISGRGGSVTLSSVRCPVRGRSSAVEACAECRGGGAIAQDALARGEFLACGGAPGERAGVAPGLDRATVSAAMGRTAVAVRSTVARRIAADALRARGVAAAPVVDGEGRPVGIVSEADLLRAGSGATVAEAMTRVALVVTEGASLGRAASLMAGHGVDRLAVVGADGVVVGVLTAADVVAWIAEAPRPW